MSDIHLLDRRKLIEMYVQDYYRGLSDLQKAEKVQYIRQSSGEVAELMERVFSLDGIDYTETNRKGKERQSAVVIGIDWTGYRDSFIVRPSMENAGIKVDSYSLSQGERTANPPHYRNTSMAEDVVAKLRKKQPRRILLFDKDVKTGVSLASAAKWAIDNSEALGIQKIYSAVMTDFLGAAGFVVDYEGSLSAMKLEANRRPDKKMSIGLQRMIRGEPLLSGLSATIPDSKIVLLDGGVHRRKKRLLVIDDNKKDLKQVKERLRDSYNVETYYVDPSRNPFKRMQELKPGEYDAILVDANLRGTNGSSIARQSKEIPVFLITPGEPTTALYEGILSTRVIGVIVKPLTQQKIDEALEKVFRE